MVAEVVKLFGPRLVDLHNYVPTCNTGQKRSNWNVLNRQGSERGFPPRLPYWAHYSLPKAGLHGRPPPWRQVLRLCPCHGLPLYSVQFHLRLLGAPHQEASNSHHETHSAGHYPARSPRLSCTHLPKILGDRLCSGPADTSVTGPSESRGKTDK